MSDEGYKRKNYEEIYEQMKMLVFGKIIKATDGNEGSVLSSLLEATARVIAEGYMYCKTGYERYLDALPRSAFGLKKIMGHKAKGRIVFHCEEIEENGKKEYRKADSNIGIQKGIEVASGSIIFVTLEDGIIEKGKGQSEGILAEAKEIGEEGNVPSGAITTILSQISNRIDGVKNIQAFENGRSPETDAAFRKRFVHYLRGLQRTNKDGIIEAAHRAGADHVNVVNYAPPKEISMQEYFTDFEAQVGYEMTDWEKGTLKNENGKKIYLANCVVYVCNKQGKCSNELLQDVRAMLEGKGTAEDSGYTPCGVHIAVLPIHTVYSFKGIGNRLLIKANSVLPDRDEASKQIKKVTLDFFEKFETGQTLIVSDLIVELRTLEWIKDIQIRSEQNEDGELTPPKIEDGQLMVVEKDDILVKFE